MRHGGLGYYELFAHLVLSDSLQLQLLFRTFFAQGDQMSTVQRGGFFIACSEPQGLSTSFRIIIPATEGG